MRITKHLLLFYCLFIGSSIIAQQKISEEELKEIKIQVLALEDLINRSSDAKEIDKAKMLLLELNRSFPAYELKSANIVDKKQSEAEEQKIMSETLSPAEYDAWKRSKNQSVAPKTIAKPKDE